MAVDSHIKNITIFDSFHLNVFYHLGKQVLSEYYNLHYSLNRWKAMDDTEPVSFDKLLNFTIEHMAVHVLQHVTVQQQYLNKLWLFRYDENDKMLLWKRKNEQRQEKSLENANVSFFPGFKIPFTSLITSIPRVIRRYICKRCLPVETMSFHVEDPGNCQRGPTIRHL